MERFLAASRTLVYVTGFVLLWAWLAREARALDVPFGLSLPAALQAPGAVLAAAGAFLALSCIVFFVVRGRGTPALFDAPRQVVAQGPYRWVRNPMYVGAVSLLAGAALLLRSPSVLGLALLSALIAHGLVLFVEEPGLAKRFGEPYEAYRRVTPRWVPRRPGRCR